jgi:hypothetical protein
LEAAMNLKPDLDLSVAAAQAIVDHAMSAPAVATILRLHGGEIAAVYEVGFVDPAHPPLVLKVYPDEMRWASQTLDLYHLYFVLELWCWMAQIGNRQPLDRLALDLERYST